MTNPAKQGPLGGLRVVEFAGVGPGPLAALMLADLGAEVLRIEKPGGNGWPNPILDRGRDVLTLDLYDPDSLALCLAVIDKADILIEGYRPGVMERLGLSPDVLTARNPGLIYGRITGWGQDGPLARTAGHDINYIALSGALAAFGPPAAPPPPPLNFVGDFGGGSAFLAFGILAAVIERQRSGRGQVIDAAILDGVAAMMSVFAGMPGNGAPLLERDTSLLGGAAPFYRCYECADGGYVSVGAIEAKFYAELIRRIGAPDAYLERQNEVALWPERSRHLEALFLAKTRAQWCELLEGTDCCFAPVLSLEEAREHPQYVARDIYPAPPDVPHHRPTPRFSRTAGAVEGIGDGARLLESWGVAAAAPTGGDLP